MPEIEAEPSGPVREARFGGVLEGRFDDAARLTDAVRSWNEVGLVHVELEFEGGSYSLLPDDRAVPGERVTPGRLRGWVQSLGEVLEASGARESAESTLHCTELLDKAVRETLFQVQAGEIRSLSRMRPIEEEGRPDEASVAGALRRVGVRRALVLGLLLLVGFGLMAWRTGYLDRIFSHSAQGLILDSGPFGGDLKLSVEKEWGDYKLTVARGPSFPGDPAELERRRESATDFSRGAALDILSAGGQIYAQLCDAQLHVLDSKSFELRPLLRDGQATVEVAIHGRMRAHTIRLSLERGISK